MQPRKEGKQKKAQDTELPLPIPKEDGTSEDIVKKANGHSEPAAQPEVRKGGPWDTTEHEPDGPDFRAAAELAIKQAKERMAEEARTSSAALAAARNEQDLIKKAKLIFKAGIAYPNTKPVKSGEQFVIQALPTDLNRKTAFDALFGNGDDRPHIDDFKGRIVDHKGVVIDKRYPIVELTMALNEMNLKGHSFREVRYSFEQWCLMVISNDLIKRLEKVIPEWDGQPRMRRKLIELFECNDNSLNEDISDYFWLSLYNRMTNPGCDAPVVLSLFGRQHAGKSFFQKLICQTVLGREKADSVKLNFDLTDAGKKDFLRMATGHTVIASGSELSGYRRGDMSKIKDFVTRTSDPFDYKYDPHIEQQRQWIIMNDANEYNGIQRDKSGNRRFYPMFLGEEPDKDGQPQWSMTFKVDFGEVDESGDHVEFKREVLQILAECRVWINKHGQRGYQEMVDAVSARVTAFNKYEMANQRGTPTDSVLDVHFVPIIEELLKCTDKEKYGIKRTIFYDGTTYPKGVMISAAMFGEIYKERAETKGVNYGHIDEYAALYGGEVVKKGGNVKMYVFAKFRSIEEMAAVIERDGCLQRVEVGQKEGSSGF